MSVGSYSQSVNEKISDNYKAMLRSLVHGGVTIGSIVAYLESLVKTGTGEGIRKLNKSESVDKVEHNDTGVNTELLVCVNVQTQTIEVPQTQKRDSR